MRGFIELPALIFVLGILGAIGILTRSIELTIGLGLIAAVFNKLIARR